MTRQRTSARLIEALRSPVITPVVAPAAGLFEMAGSVTDGKHAGHRRSFGQLSRVSGVLVIALATAVLAGWYYNKAVLMSGVPGLVAMNPVTAITFILAGCSLLLVHRANAIAPVRRLGQACAASSIVIPSLCLSRYYLPWDLGLDRLLFPSRVAIATAGFPNRMAPITGGLFALTGIALLLLSYDSARAHRVASSLASVTGLSALFVLVDYLYGARSFSAIGGGIPVALDTDIVFLILTHGLLTARPADADPWVLVSQHISSVFTRRLLPAVILVPLAAGWFEIWGEAHGWYGGATGDAVLAMMTVVMLGVILWRSVIVVDRVDHSRMQAETELKQLNNHLESRVTSRTSELARANQHLSAELDARRHAEENLRSVNRALRVLSAVNQQLVQAASETVFLDGVCRILVAIGGYRMAWVGFAHHDDDRSVLPVSQFGSGPAYLERTVFTWADDEHGRGPTGTAIRTGSVQINRSFDSNPLMAPWRDEALKHGYRSSVALPLRVGPTVIGALTIYAGEPDAFQPDEVMLLAELAGDLAFGISAARAHEEKDRAQALVERLSRIDPATDIPNRTSFYAEVAQALGAANTAAPHVAVLAVSIDEFNDIQTGMGIREADDVLKQVSTRLKALLREDEYLARTADDAFGILLRHGDCRNALDCARRIEQALAIPLLQSGIPLDVRANIGAAVAPGDGSSAEGLAIRAGIASRHAKARGGFMLYDGTTEAESPHSLALIAELRQAIDHKELLLRFEPIIDVGSGRIIGAEALVRWPHPQRGLLSPRDFIPLAEHTGLIKPLTHCVLDIAIRQQVRWRKEGLAIPIAVNASMRNLADPSFVDQILELLTRYGGAREYLQLEVTESSLMDDPAQTHSTLLRLADLGIKVSIDDFGTGFSSLSYIATLPVDVLKIDRSFVATILTSSRTHSVTAATISMAKELGLKTIAEGVESREQATELITMGCDMLQGHFFSRPLEPTQLRSLIEDFSLESQLMVRAVH